MTDVVTLSGGLDGHSVTVTVTGSHAFSLAEQYAGIITGGSATGEFTNLSGVTFTGSTGTETVATLLDQGASFTQNPVSGTFMAQGTGISTIYGGVNATFDVTGSSSVVAGVGDTITASADVTLIGGSGFSETGSVSLKFIGSLGSSTVASGSSVSAGAGNDTLVGAHTAATSFVGLDTILAGAANIAAGYNAGSITISDFNKVASNLYTLYGQTTPSVVPTSVAGGSHTVALSDKASITFSDVSHLKH